MTDASVPYTFASMPSFATTAGVNRMFSSVGAPSCGGKPPLLL